MVIYSREFATGTQQYLSLSAEAYTRTLSIGSNWNRLRIGILCAIPSVMGNPWSLRNVNLAIGICAGAASSPLVQNPAHCLGMGWPLDPQSAVTTGAWTYNAGSGGNSYYTCGNPIPFKYAGGSNANTSQTITAAMPIAFGGTPARRGLLLVDFTKSALVSGNMTYTSASTAAGHMTTDITSNDLYYTLSTLSSPTVQGTAITLSSNPGSLAFNETTNGPLDTAFVFWSNYALPLQLYEIGVFRVG